MHRVIGSGIDWEASHRLFGKGEPVFDYKWTPGGVKRLKRWKQWS